MPQDDTIDPLPSPTPVPKAKTTIPAIIFLLAASFLYIRSHVFRAPKQLNVESLHLKTLNGNPLDPTAFRGKAVVLNFWAPWCGPCQLETPWLQNLQAAHPNDLVVIGVDNDPDTYTEAGLFALTRGVTYPIVQSNGAMQNSIGSIDTVPTTFYIDSTGAVIHTAVGAISEAHMEKYATDAIHH